MITRTSTAFTFQGEGVNKGVVSDDVLLLTEIAPSVTMVRFTGILTGASPTDIYSLRIPELLAATFDKLEVANVGNVVIVPLMNGEPLAPLFGAVSRLDGQIKFFIQRPNAEMMNFQSVMVEANFTVSK